jgi:hypothetical protein
LIDVDAVGRIREIRFSNRHVQPLRQSYTEVVAFYAAYRRFAELAHQPELQVTFKLNPGDCMVFDNTRILHARTAFESSGRPPPPRVATQTSTLWPAHWQSSGERWADDFMGEACCSVTASRIKASNATASRNDDSPSLLRMDRGRSSSISRGNPAG